MRKLICGALLCVAALVAHGQGRTLHGPGDPRLQNPQPSCTFDKMYIDDNSGTMYTASGYPCAWSTAANGLPPGVTGDGNNGLLTGAVNGYIYANHYATGGMGTPGNPYTSPSGTGGIQEAINAAPVTTGNPASSTVYIPTGYYSITAGITITNAVNLMCSGWNSVLYVAGSVSNTTDIIAIAPTVTAQIKGFVISDCMIQPVSGTPGRYGIMLDGTNNEIQQGLIHHVNIQKLGGGTAIYATGSGAAQGTPVLTTIENSILTGGFSGTALGDSVTLRNNQLAGAGTNNFCFQTGATGFILDANNITNDGGTHFGNCNVFAPKIINNEFETQSTFTGSNSSLLDFDAASGSIIGGVIAKNTFNVISPVVGNAVRLNVATKVVVEGNTFSRGASGSTDVVANNIERYQQPGAEQYLELGRARLPAWSRMPVRTTCCSFHTSTAAARRGLP